MNTVERAAGPRRNPLRWTIWGLAAAALMAPAVAMRFTDEVNWSPSDFAVFAAMLLAVCGGYELATLRSGSRSYRLATGIALAGAFLLIWANLAVGIVGNEANPANMLFLAIPLLAVAGGIVARFRARGMVRVMQITAAYHGAVIAIALAAGWDRAVLYTVVFLLGWLAAARLYRTAAGATTEHDSPG